METEEVIKDVRLRLLKARRHYEKPNKRTGKRKAGDENAALVVDDAKRSNNNRWTIECDSLSDHSCRRCKRCVCSMCCELKRDLEMAWWCDECFKKQEGAWNQMVIRQGNYSSSEDEDEQ